MMGPAPPPAMQEKHAYRAALRANNVCECFVVAWVPAARLPWLVPNIRQFVHAWVCLCGLWLQPCQDERESSYSCSMFYGRDKHTMCKEKFMEVRA